jgi:hypothetical protein
MLRIKYPSLMIKKYDDNFEFCIIRKTNLDSSFWKKKNKILYNKKKAIKM